MAVTKGDLIDSIEAQNGVEREPLKSTVTQSEQQGGSGEEQNSTDGNLWAVGKFGTEQCTFCLAAWVTATFSPHAFAAAQHTHTVRMVQWKGVALSSSTLITDHQACHLNNTGFKPCLLLPSKQWSTCSSNLVH